MNHKGFTLIEVIISIVMIGAIAAFGAPLYSKAVRKAQERSAIGQLNGIHAMATAYRSSAGSYYNNGTSDIVVSTLNTALNLNVIEKDMTITYNGDSGNSFTATAVLVSGQTVSVDERPLSSMNPCCSDAGTCMIVPDC